MPTYSLINNGDTGLSVRTTLNDLLGDINNGVYIGPTGPTGAAGPQGATGNDGAIGATGADGATGPIGATGATGPQGPQGIQGVAGTSGVNGTSGTSGVNGTSGVDGQTGATGPSPFPADFFETYIDPSGTTASLLTTTSSWVNNIIGPTGISGTLAGMRHYDTTVGYVYEAVLDNVWLRYNIGAGPTGATGSEGPTGPTGPSITPFQPLTDAGTVSWNISNGYNAELTLTGQDRVLEITGATNGDYGTLIINQDGVTASYLTITGKFQGGTYSFSGTASTDVYTFVYNGTDFFWNFGKNFS